MAIETEVAADQAIATPPRPVAEKVGNLASDLLTLVELQAELFEVDVKECATGMKVGGLLLVGALALGLGSIPVVLTVLGLLLMQVAGLSPAAAFAIAALVGIAGAIALGSCGWRQVREHLGVFRRSRQELKNNVTWIKRALKQRLEQNKRPASFWRSAR